MSENNAFIKPDPSSMPARVLVAGDEWEPVARWENEGGAAGEREVAADPERRAVSPQDGDATARE